MISIKNSFISIFIISVLISNISLCSEYITFKEIGLNPDDVVQPYSEKFLVKEKIYRRSTGNFLNFNTYKIKKDTKWGVVSPDEKFVISFQYNTVTSWNFSKNFILSNEKKLLDILPTNSDNDDNIGFFLKDGTFVTSYIAKKTGSIYSFNIKEFYKTSIFKRKKSFGIEYYKKVKTFDGKLNFNQYPKKGLSKNTIHWCENNEIHNPKMSPPASYKYRYKYISKRLLLNQYCENSNKTVSDEIQIVKNLNQNKSVLLSEMSNNNICDKATMYFNGNIIWNIGENKYFNEAKKRNLSCGISSKSQQNNSSSFVANSSKKIQKKYANNNSLVSIDNEIKMLEELVKNYSGDLKIEVEKRLLELYRKRSSINTGNNQSESSSTSNNQISQPVIKVPSGWKKYVGINVNFDQANDYCLIASKKEKNSAQLAELERLEKRNKTSPSYRIRKFDYGFMSTYSVRQNPEPRCGSTAAEALLCGILKGSIANMAGERAEKAAYKECMILQGWKKNSW